METPKVCEHLAAIKEVKVAAKHVCEECVKQGDTWLHLRTCQTCGVTLCCDSSPNKHMTQHFHQTQHPVVSSAEQHEWWLWCYVDEDFVEY
ncbi:MULTISPECIES: UBP-type zinc finger domain-containing protein [unclassified Mucilaginibacter]|uniref:UBP-type zinc finger domain-containing protein n=1 Tax=unclassified Mucilaginibacter TaxID=2617802 RepID=UPI0031F61CC7